MDTNGNQMKEFIRIKKGEYDLGLVVYTYVEEERKVAYTPALELSGIGTTEQEAVQDLLQIIQITFDYALTKGTEMLFDLGWKKVSEKMIEAPVFSDVIFGDKVEVRNANKPHFFRILEPGNFAPFPKNPHIAKFFVQMNRAEDLGTGIRNVYRFLRPYAGTVPVFREEDQFIVEIPLGVRVNGGVNILFETIKRQPGKRTTELAKILGAPRSTVEKWVIKLKKENKIVFKGSPKTGGYYAKE